MKRLCYIIPYFGKLPNYFTLFLKSCGANPDFNWLVFTDDKGDYGYPENVKRVIISFEDCQTLVKSKFNCDVQLTSPYKLCDLKPMYGYIFEEYLADYRFWGHCDVDTIMGNLGKWLTDEFLEAYDKLFCLGHMTIYRNISDNNRAFMSTCQGREVYKEVLATPGIYTFDEEWKDNVNICTIFDSLGKRCYKHDLSFNVACAYNKFRRIEFVGRDEPNDVNGYKFEDYKDALYVWERGNLKRYYLKNGNLYSEEFLYMHLQWRKMRVDVGFEKADKFKIVDDEFWPIEYNNMTLDIFKKTKRHGVCWHTQRIMFKRVKNKINMIFSLR